MVRRVARRSGDDILLIDTVDISAEVEAELINRCRDREAYRRSGEAWRRTGVLAYRRAGKAVGSWTACRYSSRQLEGVQDQQSAVPACPKMLRKGVSSLPERFRRWVTTCIPGVLIGREQLARAVSTLGENLRSRELAAGQSGLDAGSEPASQVARWRGLPSW